MPSRRSCQGLSGKEFIESPPCHRRRTHLWRFHIIFIVFIVAYVALLHFFGVEGVAFACRGVCGLVESGWKVHQSNSRATTSYHVTLSLRHTLLEWVRSPGLPMFGFQKPFCLSLVVPTQYNVFWIPYHWTSTQCSSPHDSVTYVRFLGHRSLLQIA